MILRNVFEASREVVGVEWVPIPTGWDARVELL